MFNSSMVVRRLLKSRYLVGATQRQMSALLVPLGEKEQLPFEARHQDETLAEFERFEVESREFNIRCSEELKEMNQNLITNIIERGGVDGWDTVSAEAYLFLGSRPGLHTAIIHLRLCRTGLILRPRCQPLLRREGSPPRVERH
jgi:hypothetical protein